MRARLCAQNRHAIVTIGVLLALFFAVVAPMSPASAQQAGDTYTSDVARDGRRYRTFDLEVAEASELTATLSFDAGANLAVILKDGGGAKILEVATTQNPEVLVTNVEPGSYKLVVRADEGSSDFTLETAFGPVDDSGGSGDADLSFAGSVDRDGRRYSVHDFNVAEEHGMTATLSFDATADLDLILKDGSGNSKLLEVATTANPEVLTYDLAPGDYKLVVRAQSGASIYALDVAFGDTTPDTGEGDPDLTFTGTADRNGRRYAVNNFTVTEPATMTATLSFDAGTDMDLILKDGNAFKLEEVATGNNPEVLTYDVTPGDYKLVVRAQSGASDFSLYATFDDGTTGGNTAPALDPVADVGTDEDAAITPIQLSATDAEGDAITYAASGLPFGLSLDGDSGIISGTPTVPGAYAVDVIASDGTAPSATETFTITVTNVNDAPELNPIADASGSEGAALTPIQVSATDVDGDRVTFTAINLPTGLTIDATGDTTAEITGIPTESGTFDVAVTGTDGDLEDTAAFVLTIDNTPDAPVVAPIEDVTVDEDAPIAPIEVTATDADGDALTFTATDLPDGLSIDSTGPMSAQITGTPTTPATSTVQVTANDGSQDSAPVSFDLTVADVNDAPVITAPDDVTVDEEVAITPIQVVANDDDVDDVLTYSIAGAPAGLSINGSTGVISGTPLVAGTSTPTVTVFDGRLGDSASFTLTVDNTVDDAPVVDQLGNTTVVEGSAIAPIQVTATDEDGDTLSFAATGLPSGLAIDANTGAISGTPLSNGTYDVDVTANDGAQDSAVMTFTITVSNVNDAPTVAPIDDVSAAEDVAIDPIDVTGTDEDGDTLTFAAAGLPEGLSIDAVDATSAEITGTPTVAGTYEVSVTANDGQQDSAPVAFQVTVGATNDAPTLADDTFTVAEDAAVDTVVGTVTGADEDGDELSYAITAGNDDGDLAIDLATGEVRVALPLDAETTPQYVLTVAVSDGELTGEATVTVDVTDVDEAPVADDATFAVSEDAAVDTTVGTVTATDQDGDVLSYAITAGNDAGDLAIDGATGAITVAQQLDATATPQYVLTVAVSDGDLSDDATITVDVTDVNAAPVADDDTFTVAEDAAVDSPVGTVSATDDGTDLTSSITAGNGAGTFAIDAETGAITTAAALDFETTAQYVLTVEVSDGDLSDEATITVDVTNVNEAPVADDATFTVSEDAAIDTTVGIAPGADVDGDDLTAAITAGNDAGDLAIDADTGAITVAQPLDYETTPQYVVTVEVSDGSLSDTATVTVDVLDVNEVEPCPPISTLDCGALAVDTPYALDFDGTEGGLADTGFTLVDAPSLRDTIDQSPAPASASFPDVPGYEPDLVTVEGGSLTIDATRGIQFVRPTGVGQTSTDTNTQLNQLGVAVPTGDDSYELTTTVVAPDLPGGNNSQQGGLVWFVDEDLYVKVIVSRTGASTNRAQIALESLDAPTSDEADGFVEINTANFADGQDVGLRMEVDAANGVVRGYYTLDGVESQITNATFDELVLPAALVDGESLSDGLDPTVGAGLFASKRREAAATDVSLTFTDFAVTSEAAAVNTPPTIADIADATATEGVALDPAIQAEGSDPDGDDVLTYSAAGLPAGLAIAGETGLIAGTPTESGSFEVTVTVNDGTDTAETTFTLTVDPAPAVACTPVSTLDCADLAVDTPYTLDFDGTEGGLADTGFTLVDPPSDRDAVDQSPAPASPSFPDVPGYEPDLLTVDGGNLTIDATKGIQYATPTPVNAQQTSGTAGINAQLNGLGVAVAGGQQSYELTTTVLAPDFNTGSGSSQQAGTWLFVDEDTYIKLVVARQSDTTNKVQLALETLEDPTSDDPDGFFELNGPTFANGQDVTLRMEVDAATNTVAGFSTVAGGTEQQVSDGGTDSLVVPAALVDGATLADGLDPTLGAGLFATKRSAPAGADMTATFADFGVTSVAQTGNTAPSVDPIDDVTVTVDQAIDPIQVEATDADDDVLTHSAVGLPAGLAIAGDSGLIEGTPTESGTFAVTVSVDDGTDTTTADFTIMVQEDGVTPDFTANVNFNAPDGVQPADYELDHGLPYGDRGNALTYGWVEAADGTTPLDLTQGTRGNGRDRATSQADQRLDTLVHMQANDITSDGDTFSGVDVEGVWELSVPDGSYDVTVAAGDPDANDYTKDPEVHALNVEGTEAIAPFAPTGPVGSDTHHQTATVTVNVTDGLLTIDADGGTNTKIDYVDVVAAGPAVNTAPEVLLTGDRTLFVGQDTIIPVDTFDEDGDTVSVAVTGLPGGLSYDGTDILGTVADAADAASPYTVEVTGDDGTDTTTETFAIEVVPAVDVQVNFQADTTTTPTGWLEDFGQAYGPRTGADQGTGLTYGWVAEATTTPLSLVGNARERGRSVDELQDTMIHMQYGDIGTVYGGNPNCTTNQCDPGAWELAVPDGLYEVTVSVGDQPSQGVYDSLHAINVESGLAILEFQSDSTTEYLEATAQAGVEDGRLTISAIGGSNTKLNDVRVRSLGNQPFATEMIPANRSTDVAVGSAVSASVSVPGTGVGVDPDRQTSLTDAAVRLFKVTATGEEEVTGNRGSTGGNDTIAFSPQPALEYETTYRYVIDGVLDEAGNAFGRFQSTFTTEVEPEVTEPGVFTPVEGVDFEKVLLPTASGNDNGKYFASLKVHEGYLWGTTVGQGMYRYEILADGTLGPEQDLGIFAGRAAIGLVFDQDDPDLAWVTNATANTSNESARIGSKVTLVDFSDVDNPVLTDMIVNLPRSQKDHLSNSIGYGPSGDGGGDWLYFLQGSNQAAGDTDSAWGNRGETQLSAALLRFDPQDVRAEVAANGAIDVATPEVGGSYDPYAADAPLELYSTGIRNAFDFVWHSNGHLYVPTNGTAAGGSSPGVDVNGSTATMLSNDPRDAQTGFDQGTDVTDVCNTRRIDGQPYTGGDVPAIIGHPTQLDYLFDAVQGGFYGHPNPTRCEWVLNDGSDSPSNTGRNYPANTDADPNYRGFAYNFDFNKSPNGAIEYQSDTFGGQLKNRLMVVRFSNNDDILTMQVDADGTVLGAQPGSDIGGFAGGYADPLELTEDTEVNPGNIYLNQYNRGGEPQQLYLLRVPGGAQAATIEASSNQPAAVGDALVMSATLNNEGPTDTDTVTVTNNGTESVDASAAVVGTDAGQFSVGAVGTIAAGASADVDVTFDPSGAVGVRTATLRFTTADDSVELDVRALAHAGQEGGEEPTLQQVFDTFDLDLDSGWSGLAGGTNPAPVGDEVDLDLFERAADGPVIVTPVASYAPFEDLPFGWYADITGTPTYNELGVLPNGQQQTLVPDSNPAAPLEFDPGTDAFGFYYDSNSFGRKGFTEDARNLDEPDNQGVSHRARVYPLPGDSFYVAFEDAANGDYQDYDFILDNVVAAGPAPDPDPDPIGDTLAFNFQSEAAPVPSGYLRDFGQGFGARTDADQGDGLSYGWVDDETFASLNLVGNGRDRDLNDDQRLDTLMHMDLPPNSSGGTLADGSWELAIADGSYEVTVAVGDPDNGSAAESHTINAEGVNLVDGFPKSTAADGSDARHTTGTATVEVTDGRLTVDQIGGTNTKVDYLLVTPVGTGGGGEVVAQVNFQPAGSPTPTDWAADSGQLFDAGRGYGWVRTEGGAAKTADTRDRAADSDPLDGTTMIVDDAQVPAVVNGEWEYALANGTYEVAVSVGDPEYADSTHGVSAEGTSVISGFTPSAAGDYLVDSAVVEVTDGRLTLASTGTNTKIQWITISSTSGGDAIPPQVAIDLAGPGSGTDFTGPVTVTLEITDASLEFVDVSVDGTQDTSISATNYDTPFEVSGTGNHVVEVTATDGAGNATTETAEFTIIETGDGELTLDNPEAALFDDRLVMSRIQSTTSNPATSQTANVVIGNDGAEDLTITSVQVSDADFELVNPPSLPLTLAVGEDVTVQTRFVATGSGRHQLFESDLEITHDGTNGPRATVELAGMWQTQSEGGNEPNVDEVVAAFGFGTTIVGPGQQINNQGRLEAIGDEVLSRTWKRADTSEPIAVRQLAAYHSCCSNTATLKWHQVGNKGAQTNVLTHNGQWAQTLLPRINGSSTNPAVKTFTPGPAEFSLSIDPESSDWTLNNSSPDSCGSNNAGCQLGHHLRIWPAEDRDGNQVDDAWIVVMDYSGINYDFNDNVYLVANLAPVAQVIPGAPAAPTGLAATLDGSAVELDWDDNAEADLAGYAVERSVDGGGFERIATPGDSSHRDTSAPAESSAAYRIVAIDNGGEESGPSSTASVDTPAFVQPDFRVNAGGPAVTTSSGDWDASQFLSGGKVFANTTPDIAGTDEDVIYHSEYSTATGQIHLDVPVEDGTYEVRLHFAEIYFQTAGGTSSGGVGSRVFDVSVEGNLELDDYDIIADVGPSTAVVKSFTVDVTDGTIDVDLTSVTNQAKLSAFEVVPVA